MKRYFIPILVLLLIAISLWQFPVVATVLGIVFLLISLVISTSSIAKKHKQAENSYWKITKDILILLFTLLLATLLGGIAGMYANHYATQRFGVISGILSALVASFSAGYAVRWGIGKTASRIGKQFSPR